MNKAFYITTLALSFIFICVCGYYISEVSSARMSALLDMYMSSDYLDPYSSYSYDNSSSLTEEAGWVCLPFILFFIMTELMGIIKIKTKTTKILGILGLVFGSLFLIWDLLMISSPGAISFDEVGPVFVLYGFLVMAFAIVGIIQSTRFARKINLQPDNF